MVRICLEGIGKTRGLSTAVSEWAVEQVVYGLISER
jgi:hypothetical protein